MDVPCEWCTYLSICTRLKELQVVDNVGVVDVGTTLLTITQVLHSYAQVL